MQAFSQYLHSLLLGKRNAFLNPVCGSRQPYDLHPKSLSAGEQKAAYTVHLRKAHDGRLFFSGHRTAIFCVLHCVTVNYKIRVSLIA